MYADHAINPISPRRSVAEQLSEGHAIADAGIERRKLSSEAKPRAEPIGLNDRKWVEAELGLTMRTHRKAAPNWTL